MKKLYTILTVNQEDYKLKLSVGEILRLEQKYKGNLVNELIKSQTGLLPSLTWMLDVLHASMQKFHAGTKFSQVQNIYEEYCEENSITDLIPIITELFKLSGLIPKQTEESEEKKEIEVA